MPYAVELYFDPDTEAAVRAAWRAVAEAGLDDAQLVHGFRPHVSLAVCDDVDAEGLREAMKAWAAARRAFKVTLGSVGAFTGEAGVVYLSPTPSSRLLTAHRTFHRDCGPFMSDVHTYYLVDQWVPHVTLAQGIAASRATRALNVAWDIRLPIAGRFAEVGLSEFRPAITRYVFELGGPASESLGDDASEG